MTLYEKLKKAVESNMDMQDLYLPGTFLDIAEDILADCDSWIPVTSMEITKEEREELGFCDDITHRFTCSLPEDGDEILISRNNGKWIELVVFRNDDYGVVDEDGNDWLNDVDAWMPLPKGYVKKESEQE